MKKNFLVSFLFIGFSFNLFSQPVNGEFLLGDPNITIIRVWGTSYERGYAYGYLLGEKIIDYFEGYTLSFWGDDWQKVKALAANGYSFDIDPIYWHEAQAIMDGVTDAGYNPLGYDSLDCVAGNLWYDLAVWEFNKKKKGTHCSVLMDWGDATSGTDLDGASVISRHADHYEQSQVILDNMVIVIHIPSEEDLQPWLLIGWAGTLGPASGICQSGLSMFVTILDDQTWTYDTLAGYEPLIFTFRKALESVDYNQDGVNNMLDIRDAISSNPQGYSCGWNFVSLAPSTATHDSLIALIAEVAPEDPYITFRDNSYSDMIPGDNLYCANSQIKRNNSNHYCWRYNNIVNHIGVGTGIGSQENWDLMKNYSHLDGNLQFMQFIPEWGQLKLSVYHDGLPAYMNDPFTYDVNAFFQLDIPEANFSADTTEIMVGESVQFTDLSLNDPTSWQWEFEGGTPESDTIQNPVVQYNSSGNYDVTLIASNKYGSDTLKIEDYISVGFEAVEEPEQNEFKFSPNPFTNSTILYYTLDKPGNVQFTVYNVQSQIVYSMEERQDKGEQKIQWNAEGFPAGMYYFTISNNTRRFGSGKLLKY
jgi:PKD repeat protein